MRPIAPHEQIDRTRPHQEQTGSADRRPRVTAQIRPSQDYEVIVFIAIYPKRIEFHAATKEVVSEFVQTPNEDGFFVHNQHGGKTKNSGTFFLDGFPEDFPFMTSLDRVL